MVAAASFPIAMAGSSSRRIDATRLHADSIHAMLQEADSGTERELLDGGGGPRQTVEESAMQVPDAGGSDVGPDSARRRRWTVWGCKSRCGKMNRGEEKGRWVSHIGRNYW